MDKDRIVGSGKQIKGAVKQVVGKAVGDVKLESEGKADKIEGKVQNTLAASKTRSKVNSRTATGARWCTLACIHAGTPSASFPPMKMLAGKARLQDSPPLSFS